MQNSICAPIPSSGERTLTPQDFRPVIRSGLFAKLHEREPGIGLAAAKVFTAPLVDEALVWLARMPWEHIGVRPVLAGGVVIAARLCDHTVDGCNCGH